MISRINQPCTAALTGRLLLSFVTSACLLSSLPANSQAGATQPPANSSVPVPSLTLQGSASVTAGQAETGVHETAEAMKRLRRSATELIDEVERQEQVVVSEPDIIGTVVIPAMPAPTGMIGVGPALPPRRKFVTAYAANLGSFYNVATSDVHNLVVPGDREQAITPLWNQCVTILQDIHIHYLKLLHLTEQDKLENLPIGKEALAIYDDTTAFNKPWKEIYKILKEKKVQ